MRTIILASILGFVSLLVPAVASPIPGPLPLAQPRPQPELGSREAPWVERDDAESKPEKRICHEIKRAAEEDQPEGEDYFGSTGSGESIGVRSLQSANQRHYHQTHGEPSSRGSISPTPANGLPRERIRLSIVYDLGSSFLPV